MFTFATPEPISVVVDVLSAHVTVRATERADTVVHVRPSDAAETADIRAVERTVVDFTAGTLTVRTPKTWRTYTPFGGNPSIELTVEVPTGSQVKATAAVGDLTVAGESGRCELEISSGDITVERPRDAVTAKTSMGAIRVGEAVRGVLRLETGMGDLTVGVDPRSAVVMDTTAHTGDVRNRLNPVEPASKDAVQVIARTGMGNVSVHHVARTR
ncbi:DUF4097 family beta strand repeat-containing protein [Nocardia farcinica]|uniref:DUF4097 family beta strand repeat-containing protein n=1 Tax=Nocardia farcinica TaxID=37329 RepID=UPI0024571ADA|nr:DUF4097 family beta strand repeat-containing protein [Nocardia farcinica]